MGTAIAVPAPPDLEELFGSRLSAMILVISWRSRQSSPVFPSGQYLPLP